MLFKAVLLNVRFRTFHTLATCRISFMPFRGRDNCRLLFARLYQDQLLQHAGLGKRSCSKILTEVFHRLFLFKSRNNQSKELKKNN